MSDRLRAVELELAQVQSALNELKRQVAYMQALMPALEAPLDPSIPVWQR